jgi:hypothetical protein
MVGRAALLRRRGRAAARPYHAMRLHHFINRSSLSIMAFIGNSLNELYSYYITFVNRFLKESVKKGDF